MGKKGTRWSREELLVAFRLYCRTNFGKLHQYNPEILDLSELLGRTPSAIAMKACNFASLDPFQKARNISALGNVSQADKELWHQFLDNSEAIAVEAENAYEDLVVNDDESKVALPDESLIQIPEGQTEYMRSIRARRVQTFFRSAVMASYESRCALSDIAIKELLNASHIIPWSENVERRADPSNGIVLNALYDRAFDRGLIAFDDSFRVIVSDRLKQGDIPVIQRQILVGLEGAKLRMPCRFLPDSVALKYHREKIFN